MDTMDTKTRESTSDATRLHREDRRPHRRDHHHQGLAAQPPVERQDSLSRGSRRDRVPAGGHGQERCARGDIQGGRSSVAGKRCHRHRHGPRRQARQGRLRTDGQCTRDRRAVGRLSDHAEGTRRRLPPRSSPLVDPRRAPDGDPAGPPRDHRRRARLLQQPGLHSGRHPDLHAGGLRGDDDALPGAVLRRRDRLSHAERPVVQRGQRHGAGQGVRVRADVPRRKEQDAPPPHRVLDGRARNGLRRPQRRHHAG
jgi:hypothetical protein